jgi:hypothetical protein
MPVILKYERPAMHDAFSAVKSVTMELDDEGSLDEMQEGFDDFLKALGYNIQPEEEPISTIGELLDDEPIVFGDEMVTMHNGDNIDLYDIGDSITLDLSDTYGTTTTKLKD